MTRLATNSANPDDDYKRAYLRALTRTAPYQFVRWVLENPTAESVRTQTIFGTVMYADLVGFTSLCESLAREGADGLSELSSFLDGYFAQLLEGAIFPYRGYVLQFGGDSLTVSFAQEGHARDGSAAALRALELTEGLSLRGHSIKLRIGIATGELHMVVVGDESRRTVLTGGESGHRSVALQERAHPNQVLIDAATAGQLGASASLTELESAAGTSIFALTALTDLPPAAMLENIDSYLETELEEKIALLEPFVPPPLALRLRSMPEGWQFRGELREGIIMFAEFKGFHIEHLDAAAAYAQAFIDTIRRFGGQTMKGDLAGAGHRALCLFGLHTPSDNDPQRAVLAALQAVEQLRAIRAQFELDVSVQVGLHLGPVFYGAIGSVNRYDVTTIGDAVNLAARTASSASPFEVLVTQALADELRHEFSLQSRGETSLKGKQVRAELFKVGMPHEPKAHDPRRRRQQRSLSGRTAEQRALFDAVDAGLAGRAAMIGLVGEPGVGRSALLGAVIDRWIDGGGEARLVRCQFSARRRPLAPILALLAQLARRNGVEGGSDADAIASLFESHGVRDGELLEGMRMVFTAESETDISPRAIQRLFAAVWRFVDERMTQTSRLYVIEDLHYADRATRALIRHLSSLMRSRPGLGLMTYRPSPHLDPVRAILDREILLENLSLRHSAEFVARRLGAPAIDDDLAALLWDRSQGNPRQLSEVCNFLVDRGLIESRCGRYKIIEGAVSVLEEFVPKSRRQFALSRIDQLPLQTRQLLGAASCIGRTFDNDILASITADDFDEAKRSEAIIRLLNDGLILRQVSRRPIFEFRDDSVRVVAYQTLPTEEREHLHRKIADALEIHYGARRRKSLVELARHRERGGQGEEACRLYEDAITGALNAGLFDECIELASHWRGLVEGLEERSRPSRHRQATVALANFIATARDCGARSALAVAHELEADYADALRPEQRALFLRWYGGALVSMNMWVSARECLLRAHDEARDSELRGEVALMLVNLTEDKAERLLWLERAAQEVDDDADELALRVELVKAALTAGEGRFDEARVRLTQLREEARRRDYLMIAAIAANNLADCDLHCGDLEAALAGFREASTLNQAIGGMRNDAVDRLNTGQALLYLERYAEAAADLGAALQLAREAGAVDVQEEAEIDHLYCLAVAGDGKAYAQARRKLESTDLARSRIDIDGALRIRCHLAHLALVHGDLGTAERLLHDVSPQDVRGKTPLQCDRYEDLRWQLREARQTQR